MTSTEILDLARQVLTLPTAPYHEHAVLEFVIAYCRQLGLKAESDPVGNVIARWEGRGSRIKIKSKSKSRKGTRPLVLVAHTDHPGFESLGGGRAEFLGGVPKDSFKNARVRFYTKGGVVRATVAGLDERAWPKRKIVDLKAESRKLKADSQLLPGDFGMWDLPPFRVHGGHLRATAIDDVLGVVVVLATLAEVAQLKVAARVWGAFTRAEEVGFHGAIELAASQHIPRDALVVSVEMSRERPWARIGHGPVVRVGDRMTTFDPDATFFLQEVARSLRERDADFRAQRCLMDGGTCEATAFAAVGYRVGGLCLPLGNYHNIGRDGLVRAEYVALHDLERLVQLTVEAAERWTDFKSVSRQLRNRIETIRKAAPRKL